MRAVYKVGPGLPVGVRQALGELIGAVEGDTVVVYHDGSVALGRCADAQAAAQLAEILTSFPDSASRPAHSLPRSRHPRPEHLRLLVEEGRAAP